VVDDSTLSDLPVELALAWGSAPSAQRGPKREFTLDQVLDTALAIADADGIDAVTMPSVASALGLTAMSLYRYVGSKDTLVLLLQERAIGAPPASVARARGWRAGLEAHAAASVAVYRSHPWMLDIAIQGITSTPNNLAWFDAGLATLDGTALTGQERISVVLEVTGHARFRASIERGYEERAGATGEPPVQVVQDEARLLSRLVTPERFPALHVALASGALVDRAFDGADFGLARILDGVERYLDGATDASGPDRIAAG
jgi:AcrR family transcriptional regulator